MPIVTIYAEERVTYRQTKEVSEKEFAELKAAIEDPQKSMMQECWIDKRDVDEGRDFEIIDVIEKV